MKKLMKDDVKLAGKGKTMKKKPAGPKGAKKGVNPFAAAMYKGGK